jgi:hypothetical protein
VTVSSEDMSRCFIVKEALWARLREHFANAVTYADILCIGGKPIVPHDHRAATRCSVATGNSGRFPLTTRSAKRHTQFMLTHISIAVAINHPKRAIIGWPMGACLR